MNPILKSIIQKKRRDFEELSAKQRIPEHALDGVRLGRSIRYHQGGDPARVMDLYCPTTVQTPTPVIINIHGGGLITGSKDFNRHFCINLCKMGFIVFSVEYRLCPEVTFFQQLEDIYAAMNHIDSMIPELKGDPGYCFMVVTVPVPCLRCTQLRSRETPNWPERQAPGPATWRSGRSA